MLGTSRERRGYLPLSTATPLPRRTSPAPRPTSSGRSRNAATIAPGQPVPTARQKDKFIPLPDSDEARIEGLQPPQGIFEDIPPTDDANKRGRITLYCIAESLDRKKLDELLRANFDSAAVKSYPDVFYLEYSKGANDQPGGDVFFFDYGVVACWGLTQAQESAIIRGIARQCEVQPLPVKEVEIDEFQFNYSAVEKPHIQNDTFTLHRRLLPEHKAKLAISYALSQSTKLFIYEKRVVDIVLETKYLPEALAETGTIEIAPHHIAKLIGKVFIQKAAVNLLSSVLDTPEFFWHESDSLQQLYERIWEYLELPTRVEVLNSRFSVLQEMLDLLRDHQNNQHGVRLEWIVIWLIVVEVVVGLFELLGLFGVVGKG